MTKRAAPNLELDDDRLRRLLAYWLEKRGERRLSIRSPLTIGTFLLSATVLALTQLVELGAYGIYVPAAFFGLLFLVGAACLLRRLH